MVAIPSALRGRGVGTAIVWNITELTWNYFPRIKLNEILFHSHVKLLESSVKAFCSHAIPFGIVYIWYVRTHMESIHITSHFLSP
jgi:hypothetical protein